MDEVVDVNGITYVLAPKLKKNCIRAKQTTKAGMLSSWNLPARMPTAHIVSTEMAICGEDGRNNPDIKNPPI